MIYGILSLNIYQKDNNWGSLLQSWALQQVLIHEGIESQIVDYKPNNLKINTAKYPILYNWPIKSVYINFVKDSMNFYRRDKKFKKFIRDHYTVSKKCNKKTLSSLKVDGFITGSDIIWNEKFWNGIEPAYFCDCVGMDKKINMSYAPSMGAEGFSNETLRFLPKLLENYKYLSIRELSRVDFLQEFTEKRVYHTIDPTLLLSSKDYDQITSDRLVSDEYILVYCVGQDEKLIYQAIDYAKRHDLKIVTIKCVPSKKFVHPDVICFDDAGVEEWLSLIKYADCIFTTSFHASIFSVIYKKQFYSIYTEFSKDKICGLLDMLGIVNKSFYKDDYQIEKLEYIDYIDVYSRLKIKQQDSLDFLRQLKNGA